ncbi:hypothetical protein F2Q69_00053916 [Brassica cretica]|uniref:Uncharacterized protein n=1 Tax=Brassica cretica TaxID=69181 RepID=A0A8S9MU90_BRACR|nr:hypothetical protein F2Q69_00053916 [Brassica cretica]
MWDHRICRFDLGSGSGLKTLVMPHCRQCSELQDPQKRRIHMLELSPGSSGVT